MRRFLLLSTLACFACTFSAQTPCSNPFDGNGDGVVTIIDLLDLLVLFGDVDMDQDGVWDSLDDCVDIGACNYAASPTEPCLYIDALDVCGGACEGDDDEDGICDDVDTCVGDLDECGVCNGPGPTEIVIDEIVITYDSIYLPVDGEWFVYAVNVDTTFSYTCAPSFASCGDPVSYQGYDYATVQIGDQCWFAENLRSENYRNGDSIPTGFDCEQWEFLTSGAVALYNPVNDCTDGSSDLDISGRLYNWYAVNDDRSLCPAGWHVPSDGEWMRLENSLGMPVSELNTEGWRGSDQGSQLKTDYGWHNEGNGTNSSGFSALPAGARGDYVFYGFTTWSIWWTPTKWIRSLYYNNQKVYRDHESANLSFGYSVRCVQDGLICEADEDEDGICDDLDDCVGEFDACGVCNGPGAIYDCGCEECPAFECGDPVSYQGYDYATVQIGDQCWFAENLRNENYENGDAIPSNLSDSEWQNTTSGALAVFGEDTGCNNYSPDIDACDPLQSLNEYGRLYNWYAVDDARGLCPSGWHVPTDGEWMTMEMALGMSEAEANDTGNRGTDQGTQMKTDYGWYLNNGTNSSGFSGLPGGYRSYDGFFLNTGLYGNWWGSSPSGSDAWYRFLYLDLELVARYYASPQFGFSVRCVRDAE